MYKWTLIITYISTGLFLAWLYIGNQNLCVTFKFGLGTLSKQLQEIVRNVNKIKEKRKPLNFKLHLTTLDDANIHKSKHWYYKSKTQISEGVQI